jgi:hypothetical protein
LALIASHANGAAAVLAAVPELARAAAEGALSWDALPVEETA